MRMRIDKHGVIDIEGCRLLLKREQNSVALGIDADDAESAESLMRAILKSGDDAKCIHIHFDGEIET